MIEPPGTAAAQTDWNAVGIFGGTFDPVHFGHLRTAFECQQRLALPEIRFIPCGDPPHRVNPLASAAIRLRMLKEAVAPVEGFRVDTRERDGPSYTIDTLMSLREELPSTTLCLLLGFDAFAGFTGWREWRSIFDFAHVIVARRPGAAALADEILSELLVQRRAESPQELRGKSSGLIFLADVTQLEISSSNLRASLANGLPPTYLMPKSVEEIVLNVRCYGPQKPESERTL
jgi:nicotinate-nucleotide adenylyltransferase